MLIRFTSLAVVKATGKSLNGIIKDLPPALAERIIDSGEAERYTESSQDVRDRVSSVTGW